MHRSTRRKLNKIISDGLWGGGGEADWNGLNSAALAYEILKDNKLKVDDEEVVFEILTGANAWEENILANGY